MKKLLVLLMAMTLMFTFFVVAEAEDGAYTRTSDWKVEIGSKNGGMWAVELAFDGKNDTYWHSWYKAEGANIVEKDQCPHTMTVTFPEPLEISMVSYTPRQDTNATGTWTKAEIYGSTDGVNFTKLKDVTYDVVNGRKEAKTEIPRNSYKSIRFVTTESLSGFSTIAELRFYKNGDGTSAPSGMATSGYRKIANNGWKVEASSFYPPNGAVARAFDGNESTQWHSNYTVENGQVVSHLECPHTLTVTFPELTEVAAFTYLPRKDNPAGIWKKVEVQGSSDGTNFKKVADVTYDVVASRAITITEIPKDKYKAIRFVITDAELGYASAAEIAFYGAYTPAASTPATSAPAVSDSGMKKYVLDNGWTVEASSVYVHNSLVKAFDGNPATYWHSNYTVKDGVVASHDECPHTVIVTFPEPTEYSMITYQPRKDNGAGIWNKAEIYGSADGTNFTKLVDAKYAVSGTKEMATTEIPQGKYKAIKIVVTDGVAGYATAAEIN
ncbi:MAG: discoidin domain-containing protein, partial [Clostridia bacterium]|nr:discoidin domain-containing protein [Clostridia bacterium]